MIIIEDSREQLPIEFDSIDVEQVVRHKLDYGDYSAHHNGVSCNVYFDRKSIGDLFGTLGRGMERFKREAERCHDDGNTLVLIVEGTLTKVLKGYRRSKVKGSTIVRIIFTLWVKYGIQCVFCKDRAEMSKYIIEFYSGWKRNLK